MKLDTITVFEYDSLHKEKLGEKVYDALVNFYGDDSKDSFPYYSLVRDGIRFNQYVGVLCVGNQIIEVLPKADKISGDATLWRDRLLYMLHRVYKLDVKSPSAAPQKLKSNPILDIFIHRFLNEIDVLLNRGLVKCYHREDGNLTSLKGKLLWHKQLSKNSTHKERFYVNYTTYDREHVMNRILRQALIVITKVASNSALRGRANSTLFNFPELKELSVTKETFDNLVFDRKTEDYRTAIEIAKLILLQYMPDTRHGKNNVLALMFDMNKLWEEFVYRVLRRGLNGYSVLPQQSKKLWISNHNYKLIRPDIVIEKEKKTWVLDTKWKIPDNKTPSDADLHQMYVYVNMIQAEKVALLYPECSGQQNVTGKFMYPQKTCDMLFLPCNADVSKWEVDICGCISSWLNP